MKLLPKIIILSILAQILNIACSFAGEALFQSLFWDTIFTVAITFYAGLIPGLVVAATYNPLVVVIRSIAAGGTQIYLYDFLYALCGIFIVLVTWAFSRNKKEFGFSKLITILYLAIIAFASAFASSFAASFLDTYIRPLFESHSNYSAIDDFALVFQHLQFGTFLSYLVPRLPITILDRFIATFAGYGIYKLLMKAERR